MLGKAPAAARVVEALRAVGNQILEAVWPIPLTRSAIHSAAASAWPSTRRRAFGGEAVKRTRSRMGGGPLGQIADQARRRPLIHACGRHRRRRFGRGRSAPELAGRASAFTCR